MICTTIEKEVVASKPYLQQAIVKFADADSSTSPPLPQAPTHTRLNKGNGKGNDKNLTKKIAVATPQIVPSKAVNMRTNKEVDIPKIPQINDNTWAIVAHKDQKKTRVVNCNKTQVSGGNKNVSRVFNKENSSRSVLDKKLFVHLLQEHEWRKSSPAGIREVMVKKLAILPTLTEKIKPVHSWFAPSPCSTEARDKIFNAGNGLFLLGAKLEAAIN
ncbi:putative eka-like protein [Erysiphe necator]|uniref:Putative eka-like protein n=1 Tax=Uncinula necator TaxID=52586 RepID=A0A0B1P2C4_UNCNE|nr:putative eka-like protein [Erysiphe necator]